MNRHNYTLEEIRQEFTRPVVQDMNRLMKLRNSHPAFQGEFRLLDTDTESLGMRWENGSEYAQLMVDFRTCDFEIRYSENGEEAVF